MNKGFTMEHKLTESDKAPSYLKVRCFVHSTIDPRTNEEVSHKQECVMRPDSVGVLVHRPRDDKFVWVGQFRVGPGTKEPERPTTIEPVAGMIEAHQTPADAAKAEVEQETGLKVKTLMPLASFYMCPGIMNERMHLFYATVDEMDVADIGGLADEHEIIKIHVWTAEETHAAMAAGRMNTAQSIILWQWAQLQGLAPVRKIGSIDVNFV
jgi:ADP-ribose pyrophosphatase